MAEDEPSEHELMAELESLRARITASQAQVRDADFKSLCVGTGSSLPGLRLKGRKILKGHIAKVVAVDFAGDSKHAVSASLDGKLIIWDTWSGNKVRIIPVRTTWIMGAAFESSGRFVAVGGMDNMCTIYDLEKKWGGNHEGGVLGAALVRELAGLQGYLSCCVFVNQERIVVGSADTKVYVFDIPSGKKVQEYTAHEADVIGLSIQPTDSNVFVTASMDKTCKLFDLRSNDLCRQTFEGHDMDVNDVSFQTNGHVFTSCSEDKTCKLFDIRSDVEMASYRDPAKGTAFTCVANSKSGRLILAGSDDDTVHIWDVLAPPNLDESHLGNLWGHDARVSSMAMSPNGVATITASWDTSVRIWA